VNASAQSFPQAEPSPVWSLVSAACELDKLFSGLPTSLLEALLKLEQTHAPDDDARDLANAMVAGG
jgi:hypothetical protein